MIVAEARPSISLSAALTAAQAAVAHAQIIGKAINVAVVDMAGLPVTFLRMPQAALHSIEIAFDKAYTAVSFARPTGDWPEILKQRSKAVREGLLRRPRFVTMAGGVPIIADGQCVGAIGASGASEAQDLDCVMAGLAAIGLAPESKG